MPKFLVTEVRTVRVEAKDRRNALEKARMVLEHYAPDTIDLMVEEVSKGAN